MGLIYALDRGRPVADLRPDGRRELRPWRVPDARHVCDLRPRRVDRARSDPRRAARGGADLRARRASSISGSSATRMRAKANHRHGADLRDLRPRRSSSAASPSISSRPTTAASRRAGSAGRRLDLGGVFLPLPQLFGGLRLARGLRRLCSPHHADRFRPALEATREDAGAVALVGIDREPRLRARLGARRGARRSRGRGAGDLLLHPPRCRRALRAHRLCDGGARRLRLRSSARSPPVCSSASSRRSRRRCAAALA